MKIKNIQELGIFQGILKEGKKGVDHLIPIVKKLLNYLKIGWADECCNTVSENGAPVVFNTTLRYYDIVTKSYVVVPGGGGTSGATQEFADNADAIANGLVPGDLYYLPFNNGSYVVAVVV